MNLGAASDLPGDLCPDLHLLTIEEELAFVLLSLSDPGPASALQAARGGPDPDAL